MREKSKNRIALWMQENYKMPLEREEEDFRVGNSPYVV